MSKPKLVSGMDWSPPFPWPSHTCLRIPFKIKGRDFMVVTDEDGQPLVSYRRIGGMTSLSAAVEVEPAGAGLRELPWLVLLGWYLAVMLHQDSMG
jgi:hypothetical protein